LLKLNFGIGERERERKVQNFGVIMDKKIVKVLAIGVLIPD